MLGVVSLFEDPNPSSALERPEDIKIWLPSQLPPASHYQSCTPGLPLLEFHLRHTQALDALKEIHRLRRLYRGLIIKKMSHITSSQGTMTKVKSLFTGYNLKIQNAAACYWCARTAIRHLDPDEQLRHWKAELRELQKGDIRSPGREEHKNSESRHTPSWIWLSPTASSDMDTEDVHNSMRVEWCQAQAWAERFEEEVELLVEEMRWTLAFFEWKKEQWEALAGPGQGESVVDGDVAAGISAYGWRQAAVYRQLIMACLADWYEFLKSKSLGSSWLSNYPRPPTLHYCQLISNVSLYHSTNTVTSGDKDSPPSTADPTWDVEDEGLEEEALEHLFQLTTDD